MGGAGPLGRKPNYGITKKKTKAMGSDGDEEDYFGTLMDCR